MTRSSPGHRARSDRPAPTFPSRPRSEGAGTTGNPPRARTIEAASSQIATATALPMRRFRGRRSCAPPHAARPSGAPRASATWKAAIAKKPSAATIETTGAIQRPSQAVSTRIRSPSLTRACPPSRKGIGAAACGGGQLRQPRRGDRPGVQEIGSEALLLRRPGGGVRRARQPGHQDPRVEDDRVAQAAQLAHQVARAEALSPVGEQRPRAAIRRGTHAALLDEAPDPAGALRLEVGQRARRHTPGDHQLGLAVAHDRANGLDVRDLELAAAGQGRRSRGGRQRVQRAAGCRAAVWQAQQRQVERRVDVEAGPGARC